MTLYARMHAWGDGRSIDVKIGKYDDEGAAKEAALLFRKRFADSIDAIILVVEEKELKHG